MPWHRLGTVSVTQNSGTVTGANTAFAANTRIGDAFIGPDGRQYELGNVASDTVISIIPPYLGPTVVGAAYAVTPVNGYQKGLADQVRDWVNTYGQKMAALGTTGNYDVLPANKGGTGISDLSAFIQTLLNDSDAPAGRITLGAAKSGANDDITALTGMTMALSVAQGGTGGKTQAAARTGLGLKAAAVADILGTVSQSGDVPSGAIIETGNNANGTYIKWADGTLICQTGAVTITTGSIAPGGMGPSGQTNINLPASFATIDYSVQASCYPNASWEMFGVTSAIPAGVNLITVYIRNGTTITQTFRIRYIAIGRWY